MNSGEKLAITIRNNNEKTDGNNGSPHGIKLYNCYASDIFIDLVV
jgi:hypothetical protein